jgi:hypothetical protein
LRLWSMNLFKDWGSFLSLYQRDDDATVVFALYKDDAKRRSFKTICPCRQRARAGNLGYLGGPEAKNLAL